MEVQYRKEYSPALGRDMECKIYGHKGRPVLFIPCQDGRFFDFENFQMTDTWSPWLESGEVMVFSIDTIDQETWSDTAGESGATNSGFSILQMRWSLLCGRWSTRGMAGRDIRGSWCLDAAWVRRMRQIFISEDRICLTGFWL